MLARNRPITFIAIMAVFIFFYSYLFFPSSSRSNSASSSPFSSPEQSHSSAKGHHGGGMSKGGAFHVSTETIHGEVIMPKLGNETINASHFRILLQKYPPQTSSRDAASQWGCVVHNAVNERLGKEIFDCGTIADKYHCGCAEEDEKKKKAEAEGELVSALESSREKGKKQKVVGEGEDGEEEMKLVKEG
ncbi:hypothetical protein AA313_de0204995 [Arthrobotrys entomopaga]|nr:hypothetical protein AA313_de0204995 [Arthrobotrys entomopaga]